MTLDAFNYVNTINNPKTAAIINRLNHNRAFPSADTSPETMDNKPEDIADYGFSIHPPQGALLPLLCRSLSAARVVGLALIDGWSQRAPFRQRMTSSRSSRRSGGSATWPLMTMLSRIVSAIPEIQKAVLSPLISPLREAQSWR
ncbi:hypothetical protein [Lonsdalea populi]|uniref:hypothetical protein n=1 Tax=Lonsdalea populi TaxID=1172565 RepID=UPI000A22726C|nr:hypothetical protein [Lonsdalea populi]OSN01966.1 hypothetical protein AU499_03470 [Lonsdalea populi]QPQ25325.1 hypothetical protein I6N93_05980 [Lonsdalea populi]RAT42285.1 hypothetical protein AU494_11265 [Lonsdalea populi]RAT43060.1 hypothetical protein AU495_10665 [Lonsdalea populi]RAT54966.1 hypothetical protein AU500_11985 [Lonsdalea populi]